MHRYRAMMMMALRKRTSYSQSVSAKGAGKKEADTVLDLESRLISEREAALSQFQKIVKDSSLIKKDLKDGEPTTSSLVSGQVEQLTKYKTLSLRQLMPSWQPYGTLSRLSKSSRTRGAPTSSTKTVTFASGRPIN